ncbi:hypothetical protein EV401DRAFT_1939315 [Pisolithus croceorrhizus]|nr:hypothetical protein EV401DRAFT_1939315 [Pisolithus croceorrhizus]
MLLFSIVGWHALTLPQDPAALRSARDDMLAMLLAIGLDHERSILFHQDHNLHHVELCWILNCLTRYLASLTILSIVLDVARTYASGGHGRLKTDVADAVEGWSKIVVGEN